MSKKNNLEIFKKKTTAEDRERLRRTQEYLRRTYPYAAPVVKRSDEAVREEKAGKVARREKAGKVARKEKAGKVARKEKAGKVAKKSKVGETARRFEVERVMGKFKAGGVMPRSKDKVIRLKRKNVRKYKYGKPIVRSKGNDMHNFAGEYAARDVEFGHGRRKSEEWNDQEALRLNDYLKEEREMRERGFID